MGSDTFEAKTCDDWIQFVFVSLDPNPQSQLVI